MKISKLLNMYEDVVSMANFKAKKGGEDETLVHINSVIITGCEGPNDDNRFPFGQEISLEEAQTLINKEDYKKYIQGMGCDKCFFQPKFTVNGEEKSVSDYLKYSSELRVDLHDGAKYGYEHISIIENLKAVLEHSGLKNIIIDNKEIPYDKTALEKEFGTKEDAMQKYVDSHKIELPQGKGCVDKTLDEIAVGDIFQDSDYSDYSRSYYYDFYRVVKKTSKSVWFEPLKRQRVEEPVIKDGRIDYQGYQYPSEEVDADKQGKGYHLMDFSKPFRLTTKYDNKVKAEQGAGRYKVTLYPWSGTALAEEFKMKKSIYAKLNEKFAKFFEEEIETPKADGKKHIEIVEVTFKWKEGDQKSNDILKIGKTYPYEEAQKRVYELDYYTWNSASSMLYDGYYKSDYTAKILVDGQEDTYDGHIEFGQGYKNPKTLSFKYNMQYFLGDEYVVDSPDIPYDIEEFKKKYGTREENAKKYIEDNKPELPVSTDYSIKSIDEIAVGDIFFNSKFSDYSCKTYYDFYRVTKKAAKSIWLEPLKKEKIEVPVLDDGRIDYTMYEFPSEEVNTERLEKTPYGFDFSKPFRLTDKYSNTLKAEQGYGYDKVEVFPWKGQALKEEFKMEKSIYAKLNEKFAKLFEEYNPIVCYCHKCKKYYDIDIADCPKCKTAAYLQDFSKKDLEQQGIDIDKINIEKFNEEDIEAPKASNEIARKLDEPVVITRCNNCMTYLDPEVKECPKCKTDAYLMDMSKADLDHQGIDVNKITVEESLNDDIVTVIDIPLVTEKLYNKLVNLLYGNKKDRDYEQQGNVLNFLQKIEDRIPIGSEFHTDLEDYGFTTDEINAIKKIVRDERVDESLNEEKEKLDIRELIEGYNFSIIKTRVPEQEVLEKSGMDEFDIGDYEGHVGEPCFVLYDNMKYEVRAIFLGKTLTPQISIDIAENLDTFINDSIWEDVVDNFIPDEDRAGLHDFPELFEYLKSHDTGVSEWETTVVEMLATGNKDLFKEITDMKEEDFKKALRIYETLKEEKDDILKKIADEIKAEIEKIYADDKDLLEYFHVEPGVKKEHYDDGSDMYYIEVRTELGYDELMDLSEKLDKIVQKYDKYAYFDMEGGGIITAVIDNDLINESLNEAETYPKMLTTLIKKCWYGNGRFARNGKWSIGLGGYDHGYEVYFDGDTICQIKPDNEVYFGRSEDVIKEICGYNFEQILKAIQEVESDAFIKEDEYKLIIEFEKEYLDEIYNIINKLDIAVDEQYNTFYGIYSNNEDELDEIASKIKDADKNGHFNIRVIEV